MLKNREVPQELKSFNSLFFGFGYKYDLNVIFDDLLTIIICALARETEEKLYFETIKKYTREELDIFCRLFAELLMIYDKKILSDGWCDPLGDFYECLAGNYKKSNFGQFFTPKALCDLMGHILMDSDEWGKNISEPACGSGRMVLAANHKAKGNYYICEDLDPICCKMTAINLCLHEIRAEIHCRNALTLQNHRFSLAINHEYWKHNTKCILFYPTN